MHIKQQVSFSILMLSAYSAPFLCTKLILDEWMQNKQQIQGVAEIGVADQRGYLQPAPLRMMERHHSKEQSISPEQPGFETRVQRPRSHPCLSLQQNHGDITNLPPSVGLRVVSASRNNNIFSVQAIRKAKVDNNFCF